MSAWLGTLLRPDQLKAGVVTYSYEGSSGKLTGSSAGSGGIAVSTALSYSKGFVSKITRTSGTVEGGSSTAAGIDERLQIEKRN